MEDLSIESLRTIKTSQILLAEAMGYPVNLINDDKTESSLLEVVQWIEKDEISRADFRTQVAAYNKTTIGMKLNHEAQLYESLTHFLKFYGLHNIENEEVRIENITKMLRSFSRIYSNKNKYGLFLFINAPDYDPKLFLAAILSVISNEWLVINESGSRIPIGVDLVLIYSGKLDAEITDIVGPLIVGHGQGSVRVHYYPIQRFLFAPSLHFLLPAKITVQTSAVEVVHIMEVSQRGHQGGVVTPSNVFPIIGSDDPLHHEPPKSVIGYNRPYLGINDFTYRVVGGPSMHRARIPGPS